MANTISHYLIISKLGEGGMGEVYKAQDTSLDRPVALKILPEHLVEDQDRVRRFIQEAKSASALNHPNIVTIYEIGQVEAGPAAGQEDTGTLASPNSSLSQPRLSGTIHYIAMEFVDGTTLTAKIHQAREEVKKLLEYLAQASEGLAKAHAAGIVHRDLKPDNIMVTQDGFAKILDFGLAKLVESSPQKPDSQQQAELEEAATAMMDKTRPGMVMGTVGYMSPEQVQGKPVDQRSDIFSFGCILYEAVTRNRPFAGDSVIDSLHKIVYSQPAAVRDINPVAPPEVQRIIRKCLAKDPGERYQSIKEAALDLRELVREYDNFAAVSAPFVQPALTGTHPASPTGGFAGVTGPIPGPSTTEHCGQYAQPNTGSGSVTEITAPQQTVASGPVSGSVTPIPRRSPSRGITLTLVMVAALLIVVGIAYLELGQKRRTGSMKNAFQNRTVAKLTSTGKSILASISPDGKYIAHVVSDGGQQSLWLRQVATTTNIPLAPAADVTYVGVSFSRDGNYVYYVTLGKAKNVANLFQVPVLGGDAKKIIEDIDSPVSLSPDGKRLAFARNSSQTGDSSLMTARSDGGDEQKLAALKLPDAYLVPAWSPDGKTIACLVRSLSGGFHVDLVAIPAAGGDQKPIGSTRWASVSGLDWLADGSGLILAALFRNSAQEQRQLWSVSYPDGKPRQVTSDLNNYTGVSLTSDSSALVTVQAEAISNIWVAPGGDMARAVQLTTGSGQNSGSVWLPDGRLVYEAYTNSVDLWMIDSDGKNQKQITSGSGMNVFPSVSPDGRYIFFCSNRATSSSQFNIWRMEVDGGGLKQLTIGEGEFFPEPSADGKWVYYTPEGRNKPSIFKTPVDGGTPVEAVPAVSIFPVLSPDGKWLACQYSDGKPGSPLRMAVFPTDGTNPSKVFDNPVAIRQGRACRWSPDSKSVDYLDNKGGTSNIWRQPLAGGEPQRITDLKSEQVFNFDWSRKGDLALSRGTLTTDVIMIKEAKPTDSQP